MEGKASRQELEAAGHVTGTMREKRDESWCTVNVLFSFAPRPQPTGLPAFRVILLTSPNQESPSQRFVSWVILDPAELTINIDHNSEVHST